MQYSLRSAPERTLADTGRKAGKHCTDSDPPGKDYSRLQNEMNKKTTDEDFSSENCNATILLCAQS